MPYRTFRVPAALMLVALSMATTAIVYVWAHDIHLGFGTKPRGWPAWSLAGVWILSSLLSIAAAYATRCLTVTRVRVMVVMGAGILLAGWLALQPVFLSSDVFRYLWDGRLTVHGVNPFAHVPADPALRAFRRWPQWHLLAYKTWTTAYPPAAQLEFALNALVFGDGVPGWKFMQWINYVALLVVFLRVRLLQSGNLGLWRALQTMPRVYVDQLAVLSLSPPLLLEGLGAAHIDLAVVPWLLAAWLLYLRRRPYGVGVVVAIATGLKLYPIILLAAFARRQVRGDTVRIGVAFVVTLAALIAPFAAHPEKLIGYEVAFRHFHDNDSFQAILHWVAPEIAGKISTLLGAVIVLWVGWGVYAGRARSIPVEAKATILLMTLFLVSPAVHPWYLIGVIPFAIASGWWVVLWWSGTAPLSYLSVSLFPWIEYVPVYGWLVLRWLGRPSTSRKGEWK